MVDALYEATRVVRKGGLVVDARPDSRVHARLEHAGRIAGAMRTQVETGALDDASDRALATVLKEGALVSRRQGRFWQRVPFGDLRTLRAYARDHARFERRIQWLPQARERSRGWDRDPVVLIRPVRYELLERRA